MQCMIFLYRQIWLVKFYVFHEMPCHSERYTKNHKVFWISCCLRAITILQVLIQLSLSPWSKHYTVHITTYCSIISSTLLAILRNKTKSCHSIFSLSFYDSQKDIQKINKCFGFHIVSEHCFDTLKKVIENHRWAIVFYHTNTQIHSRDFTNNSQHSNDHPYNIRAPTKTPIGYIP